MIATEQAWTFTHCEDLQEPIGNCERCGRTDIRFLHFLQNEDQQIQVGCVCAGRLCTDYNPKLEEKRLRNLWSKRSRWLTRKWRCARTGNHWLKLGYQGSQIQITIFQNNYGPGWVACVMVDRSKRYLRPCDSEDQAKLLAFDYLAHRLGW